MLKLPPDRPLVTIASSSVCIHRMLYWTDWSSKSPGIYRSSVVNPIRETLVNPVRETLIGDPFWPVALTANFTGNELANAIRW